MGMAASQARYLALTARKTNTEYEGQQLNQARLVLANQSADLFNQMLTCSVPTCPDSNDFTTIQYSWSDGINNEVISDYYQIGTANEEYNYVVTSYRYEDVYTGQQKYLNDPQVQATTINNFTRNPDVDYVVTRLNYIAETQAGKGDDIYVLTLERNGGKHHKQLERADIADKDVWEELDAINLRTTNVNAHNAYFDAGQWKFALGTTIEYKNPDYDPDDTTGTHGEMTSVTVTDTDEYPFTVVDESNEADMQALKKSYGGLYDPNKTYYKASLPGTNGGSIVVYICGEDLEKAKNNQGDAANVEMRIQDTEVYYTDGKRYVSASELAAINISSNPIVDTLYFHSAENNPTFTDYQAVGNCKLYMIEDDEYYSDKTISTAVEQMLKDINENDAPNISAQRLRACFDDNGQYISGSLYKFTMNGRVYYTTPGDLDESLLSAHAENATADNTIDSQHDKLAYYDAIYVNQKIEETKKALLETDGKGRFASVKFEDDSVVYTLNCETILDEDAYADAMNQYYYKQEKYDKAIRDINAKTELIQAQDRTLELRLKKLDTEQNALQTEMEAVKKVISKNVESSFKTFGG